MSRNTTLFVRVPNPLPPVFAELHALRFDARKSWFEKLCNQHLPTIEASGSVPPEPPTPWPKVIRVLVAYSLFSRLSKVATAMNMTPADLARSVVTMHALRGDREQLITEYLAAGGMESPELLSTAVLRFLVRSTNVPDATRLAVLDLARDVGRLREQLHVVTKQLETAQGRDYLLRKPNVAELMAMTLADLRVVAAVRGVRLRRKITRGEAVAAILEGA